jgi:hypothetical protein
MADDPKVGHDELVWLAVVLPFAIVVIMNLFEGLADEHGNWRGRLVDVGWDTCVLAMGVIGGVFAVPEVAQRLGNWYLVAVISAFVLSLGSAVGIAYIKKAKPPTGKKALGALALGGASLALPSYIAMTL